MTGIPTIVSVMTTYPYSIDIDAHANSAKTMLSQLKIRHLPVMENNLPVAVITDRDIRRAGDLGVDISIGSDVKVRDVVELNIYTVKPEQALDEVLMYMSEQHVDVAIVMKEGKLAGIFTVTDVCRHYAEMLRSQPLTGAGLSDDGFKMKKPGP